MRYISLVCTTSVLVVLVGGCVGGVPHRDPSIPPVAVPVGYHPSDFAPGKQQSWESSTIGALKSCRSVEYGKDPFGVFQVFTHMTGIVYVALRGEDMSGSTATMTLVRLEGGHAIFFPEMWRGLYGSMRPTSIVFLFINRTAKNRGDAVYAWARLPVREELK